MGVRMKRYRLERVVYISRGGGYKSESHDKKYYWSGFVHFFNTSLGLWLLSTVAVSFVTFGYGVFDAQSNSQREREKRFIDIQSELINRLDVAIFHLNKNHVSEIMMVNSTRILDKKSDDIFIAPEFENASVRYIVTRIKLDFPECPHQSLAEFVADLSVASGFQAQNPHAPDDGAVDDGVRARYLNILMSAQRHLNQFYESCKPD